MRPLSKIFAVAILAALSLYAEEKKIEKTFGHYIIGGVGVLDLESMDGVLNPLGYKAPKDWAYDYGIAFYARRKLVLEGEINKLKWKERNYNDQRTSMDAWLSSVNIGYNILPYESRFTLYPFIGSGFSRTRIKLYNNKENFNNAVNSGLNELELTKKDYVGRMGVAFDFEVKSLKRKNKKMMVGLKGGYLIDFTDGDNWISNETEIKSGPKVKMNGFFLGVTVGKSARKSILHGKECGKCQKTKV